MEAIDRLCALPLSIDDTPSLTPQLVRQRVRQLQQTRKVQLVIVDYTGLLRWPYRTPSREQEVAQMSGHLKGSAKELNVPLIALTQLNRENERRSDSTPRLVDIRDSGACEQDADVALFIYRPEASGVRQVQYGDGVIDSTNIGMALLAKQRNGPTGTCLMRWRPSVARFDPWDEGNVEAEI